MLLVSAARVSSAPGLSVAGVVVVMMLLSPAAADCGFVSLAGPNDAYPASVNPRASWPACRPLFPNKRDTRSTEPVLWVLVPDISSIFS